MTLYRDEYVIDDDWTDNDILFKPARGYDPDQVDESVLATFGSPDEIPLIPESEWSERIKEQERHESRISDILRRASIPSTDQNGHGYCWAYSTGGCVIALRAINNQPYLRLNPHSVAAIIKRGADQGGWCGQSARFLKEHGIAVMGNGNGQWPEHSRNLSNDNPAVRANMKLHRVTEDWIDLRKQEWNDDMTFAQVASCLLAGTPCALDFNWWGHSVMGCDLVEVSSGSFGIRIRNSWTDSWGDKGFSVLQGSKSRPNGAVALRATGGSIK